MHVQSMLTKRECHSHAEATRSALDLGLLELSAEWEVIADR